MAITITGEIASSGIDLISAYNPNIIQFTTDSATTPASAGIGIWNSELTVSNLEVITLTPSGNNVFTFDFNLISTDLLLQANNYLQTDYTYPDLTTASNALFNDNKVVTLIEYLIAIYDVDGNLIDSDGYVTSIKHYFLKASSQVLESPLMTDYTADRAVYNPLIPNKNKMIVWQGFPIDFVFDAYGSTSIDVIRDATVLFTKSVITTLEERMLRLCLIDDNGNELSGISNNASNSITTEIMAGTNAGNLSGTQIDYRLVDYPDCAKYFRWKNIQGGESYFLFENAFQTQVKRNNKKNINRNFTELSTSRSRKVSLGNENSEVLVCHFTSSQDYENDLLQSLILSPVIELYKGGNKWQRVNIISKSGDLDSKQTAVNYTLSFDLGVKYNQSI